VAAKRASGRDVNFCDWLHPVSGDMHVAETLAISEAGDRGGEIAFDFLALLRHVFLQSPLFYAAFIGALLIGCSLVVAP
jgi:hypothetical protein